MAQLNWCFWTHCHPFCWIGHFSGWTYISHRAALGKALWQTCIVSQCVCVCSSGPALTSEFLPLLSLLDPEPVSTGPASITLTDCFLNVDKKDYLSASAWVAEQVINTKHFPYCTSSLNVELTPVSVCCQLGAIYPGLIDRTWVYPRPSETRSAPHTTHDHYCQE